VAPFVRGGRPHHVNGTTAVAEVELWPMPGKTCSIAISNQHATQALEVFFDEESADAGAGAGWLINAGMVQEFSGEFMEIRTLAAAAVPFRIAAFTHP
jgi:hypothetical protein